MRYKPFLAAATGLGLFPLEANSASPQYPTVSLSQGTFRGNTTSSAGYSIEYFKGLRFAKPLDASYRFRKPEAVETTGNSTVQDAFNSGATCLEGDDCLFLDVYRPQGVKEGDGVPVVVWTHGGGFTSGSPSEYPGTSFVAASARFNKPVIHVSLSYRYAGFGFMAGKDIIDAVASGNAVLNAGLYDQRQALYWIQDNIAKFGGNPRHVTLWGQSAGAQSVGSQLVANGGQPEGLFHGAIIQSGGPMAGVFLDADNERLTATFRNVSSWAGCGNSTGPVECLRTVEWSSLLSAVTKAENTGGVVVGNIVFSPVIYPGDYFFPERPRALIGAGKVADVPILAGSVHDEGGFFGAMFESQVTTADEFVSWFTTQALVDANATNASAVMDRIFELYPDVPAEGCPYPSNSTATSGGFKNITTRWYEPYNTNQFKRAISVWSDWNFVAPRRYLMKTLTESGRRSSPLYGYLFSQIALSANKSSSTEVYGCAHTYELPYLFCTWGEDCGQFGYAALEDDRGLYDLIQGAWVGFVNSYDPNSIVNADWPQYGKKKLLKHLKGSDYDRYVTDTYREEPIGYLIGDDAAPVLGY